MTERAPLFRVPRRGFERTLRQAHRLRRNPDAPPIKRLERDSQALPLFAEAVFDRHAAIRQHDFNCGRKMHAHFFFVAAHSKSGK